MPTAAIYNFSPSLTGAAENPRIGDEFATAVDERMLRRNVLLKEHLLAWAGLLDDAGWCVALRMDAGGCHLSSRAEDYLTKICATASTWKELVHCLETATPGTLELAEGMAVWSDGPTGVTEAEAVLTRRESEVMSWLRQGKTCPEIAVILGLSHRTVEKHVSNIYRKAGVSTRSEVILNRGHAN
jgi:DNA-binding CsgD family transcriptional regulator